MNATLPIPERVRELIDRGKQPTDSASYDTPPESVVMTAAAIGAGVATRKVCKKLWTKWRGEEPPVNPADSQVSWSDALIWAASVGAAVGVARVLSRRSTTAAVRQWKE